MSKLIKLDMEYIKQQIEAGKSIKELAKELKISDSGLCNRIKKHFKGKYELDPRKISTNKAMERTRELLNKGYSTKEISAEIGRCLPTVYNYISEINMEYREKLEIEKTKKVIVKKEIKVEKEYEKRNITYSGWGYQMCGTWGF